MRHGGHADPETGEQYTVKFYRVEKVEGRGKTRKDERQIVLSPQNPEFADIVIDEREAVWVRVIAEVIEVLDPP